MQGEVQVPRTVLDDYPESRPGRGLAWVRHVLSLRGVVGKEISPDYCLKTCLNPHIPRDWQ